MVRVSPFCLLAILIKESFSDLIFASKLSQTHGSASAAVRKICDTIASHSSKKFNFTIVFVLHTEHKTLFNFLWSLPRAHVYLAKQHFPLKARDREITISWERDIKYSNGNMDRYWDLYGSCGFRDCDDAQQNIEHFHMEKRVLIQIRELRPERFIRYSAAKIRDIVSENLPLKNYLQRYAKSFVVVTMQGGDNLHSSFFVKRSGHVVGKNVMSMLVQETDAKHTMAVFDSIDYFSNRTEKFKLEFLTVFFPDGSFEDRIWFNSCRYKDKLFVYAYTYQPVRLAVPLKWTARLVSHLPKYASVELPLTFLSLFTLPMVLSLRRYRSFRPTSSTWRSSFHLLSGESRGSLICSSVQGTLILVICGLVSLLIQFPINLLKGEVVYSTQVEKIQPSECNVRSCDAIGYREPWFYNGSSVEFNIIKLANDRGAQGAVTAANMKKGCSQTSLLSSGMMNWTKLALLVRYHTLCNDPELMKLQMTQLGRKLVFEHIPGSQASQPLCSLAESHGGQVNYEQHVLITRQILEHGLLSYHHVKASLYPFDHFEARFWERNNTKPTWGNSARIKQIVLTAMATLENGYDKYQMMKGGEKFRTIQLYEMAFLFVAFFGITFTIAGGAVFGECLRSIIFHKIVKGESCQSS